MTIETLERYRGMHSEVQSIEAEIKTLYSPVASPNGRTDGGHASTPSAPTERAAMRIIDRKFLLQQKQTAMMHELDKIEVWLDSVDDCELRALIRWYYILGLTWKQTSIKVYGYSCYNRAYQKVHRYFGEKV